MSHRHISKHLASKSRIGWRALWPVWAICSLFLVITALGMVEAYLDDRPEKSDAPVSVLRDGQDLRLNTREVGPGTLRIFEASFSGQKLRFIVQRTRDNSVHAALASCKACIRSRNSHFAHSGEFICGQCKHAMWVQSRNQRTDADGCVLPEVPHSESEGIVTVAARDIQAISEKAFR